MLSCGEKEAVSPSFVPVVAPTREYSFESSAAWSDEFMMLEEAGLGTTNLSDYAYGPWPNSGEMDIMEHVGYDQGNVHFSLHTQLNNASNSKTNTTNIPTVSTDFHIYREDWTPAAIKGYYDDKLVFTYTNDGKGFSGWPFDKPFHILLNVAVGGNWGGVKGVDHTIFPVSMQVDYVRFYKMITRSEI
jgi:beta-glucanase (GH16 family)